MTEFLFQVLWQKGRLSVNKFVDNFFSAAHTKMIIWKVAKITFMVLLVRPCFNCIEKNIVNILLNIYVS